MPSMNQSGSGHRAAGLLEDVALERMNELVPEHVIRLAERRRKRQHALCPSDDR